MAGTTGWVSVMSVVGLTMGRRAAHALSSEGCGSGRPGGRDPVRLKEDLTWHVCR